MKIIISPAKKMRVDTDSMECKGLPVFLAESEKLLARLRSMTPAELQKLWKCNDQIAALNVERLQDMRLDRNLTPALLAYEGIQYRCMAPEVFTDREFAYIQEHLRILSGFYGILRPFDGIVPYRLEMQAALAVDGSRDLYAFWSDRLAKQLFAETDCIINLASKEYSRCITAFLPPDVRMITCVFGEEKAGKIIEKGTMCKMARGEMVRFMAENQIEDARQLKEFHAQGYRYAQEYSDDSRYVFLKETKKPQDYSCG